MVAGILLALTFISISLYIFFIPLPAALAGKKDLHLYAILIGVYGAWRAIRVFMLRTDSVENN